MDLNTYQRRAADTDQTPDSEGTATRSNFDKAVLIPVLGLAGEAGGLLSEIKKSLRDGPSHHLFPERIEEELGDILWYTANIATKFGLRLQDVASRNLAKVDARWNRSGHPSDTDLDGGYPVEERLPRKYTLRIAETVDGNRLLMTASIDGQQLGDPLTDNAREPDGYRFHDVFHVGFAALLGWSPVVRANLRRKRKSDPIVDEVEDGGRAAVIEEAVSALVFNYARDHRLLEGISSLDYSLLRTIKSMTAHLEVSVRSEGEWENAILVSYEVFRRVLAERGGEVAVDADERTMRYVASVSAKSA